MKNDYVCRRCGHNYQDCEVFQRFRNLVLCPLRNPGESKLDDRYRDFLSWFFVKLESQEKWISVTDRLPDIYDYVIVFEETSGTSEPKPISIARRIPKNHLGYEWDFLAMNDDGDTIGVYMDISYPIDAGNITHWMPLPKPPQTKRDQ